MNKLPAALRKQVLIWLISGLILIIFLVATDPLKLPLPLLLAPFVVFSIWIRSGVVVGGMLLWHKSQASRKLKVIAASLAAILLLVVTLQSLGQLSWRDMLLVGGLVMGLLFYFYKTDLF